MDTARDSLTQVTSAERSATGDLRHAVFRTRQDALPQGPADAGPADAVTVTD
jgi:hypothetical protein